MNKDKKLRKILEYNLKVQEEPELINKDNLPLDFNIAQDFLIEDIESYFFREPEHWHLPAKNYFVRICIALYVQDYFSSIQEALNQDWLLPYDDKYSNKYSLDKELYDAVLDRIHSFIKVPWLMSGYNKTMDIFGKYYEKPLKERILTIGYNNDGQDFFDLLYIYKNYIRDFFFSFWHTMRNNPLNEEEVLQKLKACQQYGIRANLLLNTKEECEAYEYLISRARECTYLRAVTVLDLDTARKVRELDPGYQLSIHLSTLGAQYVDIDNLDSSFISYVNLHEPSLYTEQHKKLIMQCKKLGIRIKYIANRNCIWNKWETMSELTGQNIKCQNNCQLQCKQLLKNYPWLDLCRTNMQKEMLIYWQPDLIKLSTREMSTDDIKKLLKYWTDLNTTSHVGNVIIPDFKFNIYMNWIWYRTHKCNGQCAKCLKCKEFYRLLTE